MQLTTETKTHTIEISNGCLTIGEHTFPDNCVSLSPEETQTVLTLLAAQYEVPAFAYRFCGTDSHPLDR
jgi:hypothetical protein